MKRASRKTARPIIRPAIDSDIPALAAIDRLAFESRWEIADFRNFLHQLRGVGFIAERNDQVIGYALCESFETRLQLVRIAVHPRHWGTDVGRSLLRLLKSGLRAEGGRQRILAEVNERNLPAQMFLRACGFVAIAAIEGFFGHDGAVQMEFRLEPRDAHLDFFCFRRARQM